MKSFVKKKIWKCVIRLSVEGKKWNNISFQSNEKSVENRSGTEYKQILTRLSYEWWN